MIMCTYLQLTANHYQCRFLTLASRHMFSICQNEDTGRPALTLTAHATAGWERNVLLTILVYHIIIVIMTMDT